MADEDGRRRLGRLVLRRREALGLERKELASLATLSYPYVAQIENGDREPSLRALQSIAGALGLGVSDLTGALEGSAPEQSRARSAAAPPPAAPPPPMPAAAAGGAAPAGAPRPAPAAASYAPNPSYGGSASLFDAPAPQPEREAAHAKKSRGSVARRSVVAELHELLERLDPAERLTALGELQGLVLADVVRAEIAARLP